MVSDDGNSSKWTIVTHRQSLSRFIRLLKQLKNNRLEYAEIHSAWFSFIWHIKCVPIWPVFVSECTSCYNTHTDSQSVTLSLSVRFVPSQSFTPLIVWSERSNHSFLLSNVHIHKYLVHILWSLSSCLRFLPPQPFIPLIVYSESSSYIIPHCNNQSQVLLGLCSDQVRVYWTYFPNLLWYRVAGTKVVIKCGPQTRMLRVYLATMWSCECLTFSPGPLPWSVSLRH